MFRRSPAGIKSPSPPLRALFDKGKDDQLNSLTIKQTVPCSLSFSAWWSFQKAKLWSFHIVGNGLKISSLEPFPPHEMGPLRKQVCENCSLLGTLLFLRFAGSSVRSISFSFFCKAVSHLVTSFLRFCSSSVAEGEILDGRGRTLFLHS